MTGYHSLQAWRWRVATVLSWAGALDTFVLISDWRGSFCSEDATRGCRVVLASSFGKFSGVPLAWFGLAAFLLLLACLLGVTWVDDPSWRSGSRQVVRVAAPACGAISLATFGLQVFVIRAICPLCCIASLCFCAVAALTWRLRIDAVPGRDTGFVPMVVLSVLGAVALPVLIWRADGSSKPTHSVSPETTVKFDLRGGNIDGSLQAPLMFVVFVDLECAPCRSLTIDLQQLKRAYDDQMAIAYKNLPMEKSHRMARSYARAALAAGAQGRFADFHSALIHQSIEMNDESLVQFAEFLGLNRERFLEDFRSTKVQNQVTADIREAHSLGITQTPALFFNGHLVERPFTKESLSALVGKRQH